MQKKADPTQSNVCANANPAPNVDVDVGAPSHKSTRTAEDALALMGYAAHNVTARVAASIGNLMAVAPQF